MGVKHVIIETGESRKEPEKVYQWELVYYPLAAGGNNINLICDGELVVVAHVNGSCTIFVNKLELLGLTVKTEE